MSLLLATLLIGLVQSCQLGYYSANGNCYPCPSGCSTCLQKKCYSCEYGYTFNSTSYSCDRYRDSIYSTPVGAIVGSIVGCILFIIIVIAIVYWVKRRNRLRRLAFSAGHHNGHGIIAVNTTQPVQQVPLPIYQNNLQKGYQQPYPAAANSFFTDQSTGNLNAPYVQRPQINAYNFASIVLPVQLDAREEYYGQGVCLMCSNKFSFGVETRVLPCGHPFHGKCAYDTMVAGQQKYCPVCKASY